MATTQTQDRDVERDSLGKHSLPATDGSRPSGARSDSSQRGSSYEWNLEPAASGLIARAADISVPGTSTHALSPTRAQRRLKLDPHKLRANGEIALEPRALLWKHRCTVHRSESIKSYPRPRPHISWPRLCDASGAPTHQYCERRIAE